MLDESESSSEVPRPAGGRPKNNTSKDATDNAAESPSQDELATVLDNPRHRYVLHSLETSRTPMALADLADELVRWETDTSPTAVQDERERIYISLYHRHLPILVESGLVCFDSDRKLVDRREDADELPHDVVRTSGDGHRQRGL